jgi:hypothetical protein
MVSFEACPLAVVVTIASHLEVRDHVRLRQCSRLCRAATADPRASPIELLLTNLGRWPAGIVATHLRPRTVRVSGPWTTVKIAAERAFVASTGASIERLEMPLPVDHEVNHWPEFSQRLTRLLHLTVDVGPRAEYWQLARLARAAGARVETLRVVSSGTTEGGFEISRHTLEALPRLRVLEVDTENACRIASYDMPPQLERYVRVRRGGRTGRYDQLLYLESSSVTEIDESGNAPEVDLRGYGATFRLARLPVPLRTDTDAKDANDANADDAAIASGVRPRTLVLSAACTLVVTERWSDHQQCWWPCGCSAVEFAKRFNTATTAAAAASVTITPVATVAARSSLAAATPKPPPPRSAWRVSVVPPRPVPPSAAAAAAVTT